MYDQTYVEGGSYERYLRLGEKRTVAFFKLARPLSLMNAVGYSAVSSN